MWTALAGSINGYSIEKGRSYSYKVTKDFLLDMQCQSNKLLHFKSSAPLHWLLLPPNNRVSWDVDCNFPFIIPNSVISTLEPDQHQNLSSCATCRQKSMRVWGAIGCEVPGGRWNTGLAPLFLLVEGRDDLLSLSFSSTEQSSSFCAPFAQCLEHCSPRPWTVLKYSRYFCHVCQCPL